MSAPWQPDAHDESEFGPGAALVLSLFAVFILVAALGWRDVRRSRAVMPTALVTIAEGNGGQGYFEAGKSNLDDAARKIIAGVARRAVAKIHEDRKRGQRSINHLQVIGYASPEGRSERNRQLAEERAMAVRNHLVNALGVPDDCVVVASYADSHSTLLNAWTASSRSHDLGAFKRMTREQQIEALKVVEDKPPVKPQTTQQVTQHARQQDDLQSRLRKERRVTILGVYHSDSTCRLDRAVLRTPSS